MKVPISGQVTGKEEIDNITQVANSQHYGGGEWMHKFERGLAKFTGKRHAISCNSGSSANLLALSSIELPPKSHVLTSAVNFPTTVNAIIQRGLTPVFVDADPKTLNIVDADIDVGDIRAILVTHMMGNPVDLTHYEKYKLPLIEDCCDALGSMIHGRMVGSIGIMATYSFYPAHHMTMGEGGAVTTDSPKLKKILESLRDWGRECWCAPGEDNTCGTRFENDYDHKYTYSRIGYNLKLSDLQAASGVAQLDKLSLFIQKRKENWKYLRSGLDGLPIEIIEPAPNSDPSWFGFAFLCPTRNNLARFLDGQGIGNRPIMAGNILRQPAYRNLEHHVIGNLDGANRIHECGLWVGCFPGLSTEQLDYTIDKFHEYFD